MVADIESQEPRELDFLTLTLMCHLTKAFILLPRLTTFILPTTIKWQPTPVFLPGESQGQGSLVGCRLWGRTESDTTEAT